MKLKVKWITATMMATLLILNLAVPASASLIPAQIDAALHPEEFVEELKCLDIDVPPKIDIVFAFDLTGSMGSVIDTAKDNAEDLMETLEADVDANFNFGVMSYMDYPHYYSDYHGYSASYGFAPDYAYSLDQPVTDDTAAVDATIDGLVLGSGGDFPQNYTRIFHESYADPAVDWRDGAKRIVLNFGDDIPHWAPLGTGGDPGRDEIAMNGDDLDLIVVLNAMAAEGIILLEGQSWLNYETEWAAWTAITGGDVFDSTLPGFVDNIIDEVEAALAEVEIENLHLEAPGFESWLESSWSYSGPTDVQECGIDVKITVPAGTDPDVYEFTIIAVDNFGVIYGEQEVIILVPGDILIDVKPESDPNAINLNKDDGVLPVAILTTDNFDASNVDPATVVLTDGPFSGFTAEVAPLRWALEDVDLDGDMDMILHFDMEEIRATFVIEAGDEEVWLRCFTFGGAPLEGMDSIKLVGNPH